MNKENDCKSIIHHDLKPVKVWIATESHLPSN